ncbi:unnamed protein product [Symbiodinium necroappetens]|uniref:Uncharacterized protein n=1 Tax=Symbiodinium necroappetens TaxID=1628268 RepID=A0A812T3Q7_9DINO|nr:unnamed protein product [Symbiodinium necroappetens]
MAKPWTAVVLLATAAFMLVGLSFQPSPPVSMTSPVTSPASRFLTRGEPQAPARRLAHHNPPRCTSFWETIWARCRVTLHWVRVLCLAESKASVPVMGPLLAGVAIVVCMLLWLLAVGSLGYVVAVLWTEFRSLRHQLDKFYREETKLFFGMLVLSGVVPVLLLLLFPWPTLPICNSAPCPCANGFCHAADDGCKSCFEGFHLSSGVCEENVCSCKHGVAIARHAEAFAKGSPPFETHIPITVSVCVSAVLFVTPIIYTTVTRRPFMLVVEVAISSADFGSDLLSVFNNDFYSWEMFVLAVLIVMAAGVSTIVGHYGGSLIETSFNTYNRLAFISWTLLADKGINQVFEIAGDSFEKHLVNVVCAFFLALSLPLLVLVLAPMVAASQCVMLFATGIVLHSTRLLLLKSVQTFYEKQVLGREITTPDTPDHVDPERYHTIILTEILTEGLPSTVLTLVNYGLMRQAYMVSQLNTVAVLSLMVSAYLVARIGFKYGHHMLYHKKALADIPLPYSPEVETYAHVGKDEVMAAGGAVAGVGGTSAALVMAAG